MYSSKRRVNVKQTGEESMQAREMQENPTTVRAAAKTIYLFLNQRLHLTQNVKCIGQFNVTNTAIKYYGIDTAEVCF